MAQEQIDALRRRLVQLNKESYDALRVAALRESKDLYKLVVTWAIEVPYEEVTDEQRMLAKNFCFGHAYGMTGRKMQ